MPITPLTILKLHPLFRSAPLCYSGSPILRQVQSKYPVRKENQLKCSKNAVVHVFHCEQNLLQCWLDNPNFSCAGKGGRCGVNRSHQLYCLLPSFQVSVSALYTLIPSPLTLPVLLLVFYFSEFCIHNVAFVFFGFVSGACTGICTLRLGLFSSIHFFAEFLRSG